MNSSKLLMHLAAIHKKQCLDIVLSHLVSSLMAVPQRVGNQVLFAPCAPKTGSQTLRRWSEALVPRSLVPWSSSECGQADSVSP